MREEACSADTIIRDEDALREPCVREGEQTLTRIIDALKSGTDLSITRYSPMSMQRRDGPTCAPRMVALTPAVSVHSPSITTNDLFPLVLHS
jgi:hypothetical protein